MIKRICGLVGATVLALTLAPAMASAATITVAGIRGRLEVTWHSDAHRCIASGLCGIRGSFTEDGFPDDIGGGFPGMGNDIFFGVLSAQARVRQWLPGGGWNLCDDPSLAPGGIDVRVSRDATKQLIARVASGVSSGRCAGPTARALALLSFPVRRVTGGLDLGARVRFHAGPFDAQLLSTLRTFRERVQRTESVPRPPKLPKQKRTTRRFEFVEYRYRVVGSSGALSVTFAGNRSPVCQPFGTCGDVGSLTFSIPHPRALVSMSYQHVTHHQVSGREALRDQREGKLGAPFPFADDVSRSIVATALTGPGGERCDATATSSPGVIDADSTPASLVLFLEDGYFGNQLAGDPLRTWCPGPGLGEVAGPNPLATGSVSTHQLGDRTLHVVVRAGREFGGLGFHGLIHDSITLTLRRQRIRAGTERETGFF